LLWSQLDSLALSASHSLDLTIPDWEQDEEEEQIDETIVSIFQSNLKKHDLSFLGFVESVTFSILDNYESTNPMLVTDSLSYFYMIKDQEINVAIEDMMREGLFVLFLNHRFAYAFFDKFDNMTKPIPAYEWITIR